MMDLKANGYAEVAVKTVENLVIKKGRCDLATITVGEAGTVKRGTLLFAGDAGKYAITGSAGNARAILAEDITVDKAGDVNAEVFLAGIFNGKAITGTITAADVDALRARDIYVETPAS